jgi:hypothetical protein
MVWPAGIGRTDEAVVVLEDDHGMLGDGRVKQGSLADGLYLCKNRTKRLKSGAESD